MSMKTKEEYKKSLTPVAQTADSAVCGLSMVARRAAPRKIDGTKPECI